MFVQSTRSPNNCMRLLMVVAAMATALLWVSVAQAQTSITARGNEPSWQLEIADAEITFQTLGNDMVRISSSATSSNNVDLYTGSVDGQPFVAVLAGVVCTDTMSGMPFPKTAIVVAGERTFTGCGGASATLLYGEWRIEQINGAAVIVGSEPTIGFSRDGRVQGNGSCNRYFGSFALTGEGLAISETGASMMACEQGLMDQERELLTALESVRRFEVGTAGQLLLVGDANQAVVVLRN